MQAHEIVEVLKLVTNTIANLALVSQFQTTANAFGQLAQSPSDGHRKKAESAFRALHEALGQLNVPERFTSAQGALFASLLGDRASLPALREMLYSLGTATLDAHAMAVHLQEQAAALSRSEHSAGEMLGALAPLASGEVDLGAPNVTLVVPEELDLRTLDELADFGRNWAIRFEHIRRMSGVDDARLSLGDIRRGSWHIILDVVTSDPAVVGGTALGVSVLLRSILKTYKAGLEAWKEWKTIELIKAQLKFSKLESVGKVFEIIDADAAHQKVLEAIATQLLTDIQAGAPNAPKPDPEAFSRTQMVIVDIAKFIAKRGRLQLSGGTADPDIAVQGEEANKVARQIESGVAPHQLLAENPPSPASEALASEPVGEPAPAPSSRQEAGAPSGDQPS